MGLDRISLKPILSLWSGNTGAGSDGKLFVVKLISLLSLHPCLPPNTPPATIKSCRSPGALLSDSHTDQIRNIPSDNTTLSPAIPGLSSPVRDTV